MAKTIVFQPAFEKKLKKLRIKTKFVKNFNNPKWVTPDLFDYRRKSCLTSVSWRCFITCAFYWTNTSEGYAYWDDIANN
jgi:hypothetical protein